MASGIPEEALQRGRARLHRNLARVKASVAGRSRVRAVTLQDLAILDETEEGNLDAIVVWEDAAGLWHGELVLKGMPPGLPWRFRAAGAAARRTPQEAEADGLEALADVLSWIADRKIAGNDRARSRNRVFRFMGTEFAFPAEGVTAVSIAIGEKLSLPGSIADCRAALDDLAIRCAWHPDGFASGFAALETEDRMQAMARMMMLLVAGIYAHPPEDDWLPDGEGPAA